MNKYKILLVTLGMVLNSCAQNKNIETTNMNIRNQHITFNNVVEETIKQVKHYDKEPMYFIRPTQNNCLFEILVNDYPVLREFESLDVYATPVEINDAILKSGTQTLTVRMHPIGDLLKDTYDIGDTVNTLLDNTSMKVEIVKYEAYNISNGLDDEQTVITHYSPTMEGNKKFKGAGLPYYEYTFSFDAEVPYENEGWSNGEDLMKFDQKELENKVLKFYNDYKEIHENKNINDFTKLDYDFILRGCVSFYRDEKYIQNLWANHVKPLSFENRIYQPIDNYEMKFYGEKRIVLLRFPNKPDIDFRLRKESSFWFKFTDEDDDIMAYWITIYLYIPKGGTLDDLQTIK